MANKSIFGGAQKGKKPRPVPTDASGKLTRNEAGGVAYPLHHRAALAQYASTGTLNNVFYASATDQLTKTLELAAKVDNVFLAQTSLYARRYAFMKDMPALLAAVLFARAGNNDIEAARLFRTVFPLVMDNAKMLRNFVQIVRSGVTGRKSLGTMGKSVINEWFDRRNADQIFRDSVGNDPSLVDVIKLAHPKSGSDAAKHATFNYLLGKEGARIASALPATIREFEAFKASPKKAPVPKVPFQLLTSMELETKQWTEIALNGGWHFVRMNLNTFARHGVLKDASVVAKLADKLRDQDEISRSKVFPYQLLMAYKAVESSSDIPMPLKLALQDAMEIATKNVPSFEGNVWVFPDVSGSMSSPVTGVRKGATTSVRCIDVAALVSASILRTSPNAQVLPFDTRMHTTSLNPRDSVMTNAKKLASFGGGGTNVSLCFEHLQGKKADLIIIVSDNESWLDRPYSAYYGRTATASEEKWQKVKAKNPNCKLVCIDIQPYATTQVSDERDSVLNIGGFSDNVFEVVSAFSQGSDSRFWVERIESMQVD